jgi:hypothetical protein
MRHAIDVLEGLRSEQRDRVLAEGAGRFDREKALRASVTSTCALAELPSALRADTPRAIRLLALRPPV